MYHMMEVLYSSDIQPSLFVPVKGSVGLLLLPVSFSVPSLRCRFCILCDFAVDTDVGNAPTDFWVFCSVIPAGHRKENPASSHLQGRTWRFCPHPCCPSSPPPLLHSWAQRLLRETPPPRAASASGNGGDLLAVLEDSTGTLQVRSGWLHRGAAPHLFWFLFSVVKIFPWNTYVQRVSIMWDLSVCR